MVQGDTSTTFAASLSAFYHKVPLAHVEAGLRTWNKFKPFPEEMNRMLTTALADLHFAPTFTSKENLKSEGVPPSSIYLTGNTVIDALFEVAKKHYDLKKTGLSLTDKSKMILVTVHRRESFGAPLREILGAVAQIAVKFGDGVQIVIPVHKNPVVKEAVEDVLGELSNVDLIEPLEYEPFVHLMKAAYVILTDSGGIQEEAPSLGKPVLVLRDVTERPEGVLAGTVKIVGTAAQTIVSETAALLEDKTLYEKMSRSKNPYGDGRASERIVSALLHHFGFIDRRPEEIKFA
jgi:UDP-N-acetylglucosamine 2-epimerase (non-hydrolysing)